MIYLDNAATSFPKPKSVQDEVLCCIKNYGGNPGRGSHALSLAAADKIYECRAALSGLFGLGAPENAVFTLNATQALNTVIKGALRQGDHVLISDMEHNAVFRPIYRLAREGFIKYSVFRTFPDRPELEDHIIADISAKLTPRTRMLVCTHASNICSAVLPIGKIGELCRRNGILFVVDAAQSAGHIPIDFNLLGADAVCLPGHKGLYGPQGCGAILMREGLTLKTLTEGGNGVNSLEGTMPELPPERYEAGTLPTPAVAGLLRGAEEVSRLGTENIHRHECALFEYARDGLAELGGVKIYAPSRVGSVLLFNLEGKSADSVGDALNGAGICVRSGYHCAALAHKTLATPPGGAVRVSFGIYNTLADVDTLVNALHTIKSL